MMTRSLLDQPWERPSSTEIPTLYTPSLILTINSLSSICMPSCLQKNLIYICELEFFLINTHLFAHAFHQGEFCIANVQVNPDLYDVVHLCDYKLGYIFDFL